MGVGVKRELACLTPKRTCDYPFCDIGESLKVIMKRPLIKAMIMTASLRSERGGFYFQIDLQILRLLQA